MPPVVGEKINSKEFKEFLSNSNKKVFEKYLLELDNSLILEEEEFFSSLTEYGIICSDKELLYRMVRDKLSDGLIAQRTGAKEEDVQLIKELYGKTLLGWFNYQSKILKKTIKRL